MNAERIAWEEIAQRLGRFEPAPYQRWIDECEAASCRTQLAALAACASVPGGQGPLRSMRFAMLIGVQAESELPLLTDTVGDLIGQQHGDWLLTIVLDEAVARHPRRATLEAADPRVQIVDSPGRWPQPLSDALVTRQADFICLIDAGDRLPVHALQMLALTSARVPKAQIIYSDEDWLDAGGRRVWPRFKTDWDRDAQLGIDLLGKLCAVARPLIDRVGGLREAFAPALRYDWHCRLAAATDPLRVVHVPAVLLHRSPVTAVAAVDRAECVRAYCDAARQSAAAAVATFEEGTPAVVAADICEFVQRMVWPVPEPAPLVSVLVPTRDRAALVANCARGVLHETDYPAIELIVLDNDSSEPQTLALFDDLRRDPRVTVLPCPGPFNFSQINNRGAAAARGEVIVFLNNDVEVAHPGWLAEMVGQAMRPEVGCVGAKLLYGDERVQHGGIVLAPGPMAYHVGRLCARGDSGDFGRLGMVVESLAVTAACLAMRRQVFEEVGGFDPVNLKVAYNDVDLCLRVGDFGYRVLWTPFAELYHLEGASRAAAPSAEKQEQDRQERTWLWETWRDLFYSDPHLNPNLSVTWDGGVALSTLRPTL